MTVHLNLNEFMHNFKRPLVNVSAKKKTFSNDFVGKTVSKNQAFPNGFFL
jgi:hypothetical protein